MILRRQNRNSLIKDLNGPARETVGKGIGCVLAVLVWKQRRLGCRRHYHDQQQSSASAHLHYY